MIPSSALCLKTDTVAIGHALRARCRCAISTCTFFLITDVGAIQEVAIETASTDIRLVCCAECVIDRCTIAACTLVCHTLATEKVVARVTAAADDCLVGGTLQPCGSNTIVASAGVLSTGDRRRSRSGCRMEPSITACTGLEVMVAASKTSHGRAITACTLVLCTNTGRFGIEASVTSDALRSRS